MKTTLKLDRGTVQGLGGEPLIVEERPVDGASRAAQREREQEAKSSGFAGYGAGTQRLSIDPATIIPTQKKPVAPLEGARGAIATALSEVLAAAPFQLTLSPAELLAGLEAPKDKAHGDHAFPCFRLAKALKKNARDMAVALAKALEPVLAAHPEVGRVEATGPFLNFFEDTGALASRVLPAILSGDLLAPRAPTGKHVMIEYSQPNTHKAFHVGHTRNVSLGDAMVRLSEWSGHDVIAANYFGDEGAHIARCLWYLKNHFQGAVPKTGRGEFLGELYAKATELLDFNLLTRAPLPGVVTAKVTAAQPHSKNPNWTVVELETAAGAKRVVTGGKGFKVGDVVPYAPPGTRVDNRTLETQDMLGVSSEGMLLSGAELGVSASKDAIYVFPQQTSLGQEVADYFRIDGALPADRSVAAEIRARDSGVQQVLKDLEAGEAKTVELWKETRQWSLDDFKEIYDWLGARFDHNFYESEVSAPGKQLVEEYLAKGVLVKSEGAIGADLSAFGLPFFLLLRSNGTGLYSTKDLALAQKKFEEFGIDRSVYVVDASQRLHFQQVFKTLELMGFEQAKDSHHLSYGMVTLPDGKMSSRKGNVILLSTLRERLSSALEEKVLARYRGQWPAEEIAETARRLAVATIRYGMLNTDPNKDIVFDLDKWTDVTGNTGPYLMYQYVRTRSILAGNTADPDKADFSQLTHPLEKELVQRLSEFPKRMQEAAEALNPQGVCLYLFELARTFSRMYGECSVAYADSDGLKHARAMLVDATGQAIKRGLELLGIPVAERM